MTNSTTTAAGTTAPAPAPLEAGLLGPAIAASGGAGSSAAGSGTAGSGTLRRRAFWLLAAVVVLVLACAASLAVGARGLPLETVWQALMQFNPADGNHAVVH